MEPKETSKKAQTPQPAQEDPPRKSRRRGYRGYPNTPAAGDVHSGSGFGGAGSLNPSAGTVMPKSGIVSERTRDDVEEVAEKKEK